MTGAAGVAAAPELARPVTLADLPPSGSEIDVVADAAELAALARRFDLIALEALTAEVRVRLTMTGDLEVSGRLAATVVQRCVVTLEPVTGVLSDSFALRFSREFSPQEEVVDADTVLVEPWPGDTVDVGEIVAQHLALALDPYPRAPGADAAKAAAAANGGLNQGGEGPFAALKAIRDKLAGPDSD